MGSKCNFMNTSWYISRTSQNIIDIEENSWNISGTLWTIMETP